MALCFCHFFAGEKIKIRTILTLGIFYIKKLYYLRKYLRNLELVQESNFPILSMSLLRARKEKNTFTEILMMLLEIFYLFIYFFVWGVGQGRS